MATYPDIKSEIVNGLTEMDGNCINQIEDYLGIKGDTDTDSITYKLTNPASIGPGHKHPIADLNGGSNGTIVYKDPADGVWKAWLPDTIGIVTKADEQTISAKKTFTVLPESAVTPTTDGQLTRKAFVDGAISGALAIFRLPKFGEMYNYANSDKVLIDQADVYKGIIIKTSGLLEGLTYVLGKTGACTTFETYGGGTATLITSNAHALVTGQPITISNSTNYNGKHLVTWIDANTFTIPVAYVAEAGGPNWVRPSYLAISAGSAGTYRLNFSSTINCDAGKTYRVQLCYVHSNVVYEMENIASELKKANADNNGAVSAAGFVVLGEGDMVFVAVKNLESSADATVKHCNLNLTKIKEA